MLQEQKTKQEEIFTKHENVITWSITRAETWPPRPHAYFSENTPWTT